MGLPRTTIGPVIWVSSEESEQLQALRLTALEDARSDWASGNQWPSEESWPFRSLLKVRGRDRDGSLLATASVRSVGHVEVYRRNARLVKRSRRAARLWIPYRQHPSR